MSAIKNHSPKCQITSEKQRLQLTRSIAAILLFTNQKFDLSDGQVSLEYENGMMNAENILDNFRFGFNFLKDKTTSVIQSGIQSLKNKVFGNTNINNTNTVADKGLKNVLLQWMPDFVSKLFVKEEQVEKLLRVIPECDKNEFAIGIKSQNWITTLNKMEKPQQLQLVNNLVGGDKKQWDKLAAVMKAVPKPLFLKDLVLRACAEELECITHLSSPETSLQIVRDMLVCIVRTNGRCRDNKIIARSLKSIDCLYDKFADVVQLNPHEAQFGEVLADLYTVVSGNDSV